jgi:integrase
VKGQVSETPEREVVWQKTRVPNLVRYGPSGTYFARVRVRGKLKRQTLKTDVFSVAQLRLADFVKDLRQQAESQNASARGKMTFGDALAIYEKELDGSQHLKYTAKLYRTKTIKALLKSWPDLKSTDVRKISASDCLQWASRFALEFSPSVFNNTVGTLRQVIKIAIRAGARYGNPAEEIKKVKVRQKVLILPEHQEFVNLISSVRNGGGRFSEAAADLIEFLAYSGARKGEAARVFGCDCDLVGGKVMIKGDAETGTKNWETRSVPMIPDLRQLLERLKSASGEKWLDSPVMSVRECQKSIDSACEKLSLKRFTHHDLRHLFATRCIESGVDIPTVAKWLGHKDGGALAMKTYGHLRNEHSQEMAKKVSFGAKPATLPAKTEETSAKVAA